MISIERAREILNDKNLTDEEVRKIRDDYRVLAEISLEEYEAEKRKKQAKKNE